MTRDEPNSGELPFRGIFVALGSNLGDRERHLRTALDELAAAGDIRVLRCSSFHETDAVGGPPGQERYLNAVAEIDTQLSPRELLTRLLELEQAHGRVRGERNAPRTLDLDLLLYHDRVVNERDLVVPHPRMWERDFVLRPLAEICDPERLRLARGLRPRQ